MPLPIFIYLKTSKKLVTSFKYDQQVNKLCTSIRHVFPVGSDSCYCEEFSRRALEVDSKPLTAKEKKEVE